MHNNFVPFFLQISIFNIFTQLEKGCYRCDSNYTSILLYILIFLCSFVFLCDFYDFRKVIPACSLNRNNTTLFVNTFLLFVVNSFERPCWQKKFPLIAETSVLLSLVSNSTQKPFTPINHSVLFFAVILSMFYLVSCYVAWT